ncbi:MAG: hypothetical protein NC416_03460 [Eubacterium sp.]|nr:hypothetical protein [Eubacterium sp.]
MKYSTRDNPNITVQDERILDLDRIVQEVKQSEEWEAVKMNILEIGIEHGKELGLEQGIQQGTANTLKDIVENMLRHDMSDENIRLYTGCEQNLIDTIRHNLNQ